MTADDVVAELGLEPHPEGGWYAEIHRSPSEGGGRGACTSIYYLLAEASRWHRIDATEIWCWHAGAPVELRIAPDLGAGETLILGPDLKAGQRPQAVAPPGAWQAARTLGAWTLVGCVVAPAFSFAGFELAPKGWRPPA